MNIRKSTVGTATVGFILVLSLLLEDLFQTFRERGFDVALASALDPVSGSNGRVPFDVLDQGPFMLYMTGYLVSMAALAFAAALLLLAVTSYSRNGEVTRSVTRSLAGASWVLMFWMVGQAIIYGCNRSAASQLGLLERWNQISAGPTQSIIILMILVAVLGFESTLMARTLKLQEDQEGLV